VGAAIVRKARPRFSALLAGEGKPPASAGRSVNSLKAKISRFLARDVRGAKLVSHGQAIKTGSHLRLMRRLFGELSDEGLSCVCGPRAYCCAGVRWGVVGGRGSGAVHGWRHRRGVGLSIIRAHQASFPHRIIALTRAAIAAAKTLNRGACGLPAAAPLPDSHVCRPIVPFQRSSSTVCEIRPTPVCKLVRSCNRLKKTFADLGLSTIRKPGERPPAPRPNNGRAT
jgi:hypothetical protein